MARSSRKKKKDLEEGSPVSKLPDDVLVDIIHRLPYKSTCSCRWVSRRWRGLFSHPDHSKQLPKYLAGFFYEGYNRDRFPRTARYFTNASGEGDPFIDPSLSFLPEYKSLDILDCCNGLLLCRCWKPTDPKTLDYLVCNPATKKWVVVPSTEWSCKVAVARLGFDPAVSSHFHVFEFIDEEASEDIDRSDLTGCVKRIEALAIYSSKAGAWTHQSIDHGPFAIPRYSKSIFLNGILHLAAFDEFIVAVDVQGNDWWLIDVPMPPSRQDDDFAPVNDVFVLQSRLCLTNSVTGGWYGSELLVWVIEDYDSGKWTLKHNVSHLQLFGTQLSAFDYKVVSFHPEYNMIFIVCGHDNTLVSYEMDSGKSRILHKLGSDCQLGLYETDKTPYFPYVPLFIESLADGH